MKHVEFLAYGPYALFSDPLTRVGGEKCSYQIPTYGALKGIIESIYWKPTIIWHIDEVRIMNRILTESKGIKTLRYHNPKGSLNDLSYYTYLKNVAYQVKAHFEWNYNRPEFEPDRNYIKHFAMAERYIEKGGRRDIFLGTRECQAYVKPCKFGEGIGAYDDLPELAFGFMYHGIDYPSESTKKDNFMKVRFWTPVMRNGIIKFIQPEECKIIKPLREVKTKHFEYHEDNSEVV